MAEYNSCADLSNDTTAIEEATTTYQKLLSEKKNPFQEMMNMQRNLQKNLHGLLPTRNPDPDDLSTCGEILDWLRANDDAIDDERRELYTSLGGMSRGEKAATEIWKNWKAGNLAARDKEFKELGSDDRLEVYFEIIDQLHFFMNQFLALKMSARDIFVLYYLKNRENFKRWEGGY